MFLSLISVSFRHKPYILLEWPNKALYESFVGLYILYIAAQTLILLACVDKMTFGLFLRTVWYGTYIPPYCHIPNIYVSALY